MAMGDTDLFVVCKSCGSEVSPYITECPYCGTRLRKRAPKLDRDGRPQERRRRRRAQKSPSLPPMRRGEIPGVRVDGRPYGTVVLLLAAVGAEAALRAGAFNVFQVVALENLGSEWWRIVVAPFVYNGVGYQFTAMVAIALFGWLLERRIGPVPVVLAFLACGAGGMALAVGLESDALALGGNGAALGLLALWSVPDMLRRRAGEDTDSDLLGVAVIAAVLLALPVAVYGADAVAGTGGGLIGATLGLGLHRSGR